MTEKSIIIGGVNVAGCEFNSSTPCSELCYMKGNKCNDNSNCYYKQLQRKEQECEELINHLTEANRRRYAYKQALEKIKDIVTQINFTVAGGDESPKHEWIRLYRSIVYEVSKIINEVK